MAAFYECEYCKVSMHRIDKYEPIDPGSGTTTSAAITYGSVPGETPSPEKPPKTIVEFRCPSCGREKQILLDSTGEEF